MRYEQTKAFVSLLAPMDGQLKVLRTQEADLAGTIAAKKLANETIKAKTKRHKTGMLEIKLRAVQKEIRDLEARVAALRTLTPVSWPDLRDMLCQAEEHAWNARQLELGNKEREDYEGKYEDSYRDHMGWPLGASLGTSDFPDSTEGKYLSGPEATFRVGKVGKRAFGSLLRAIAREFKEDAMTIEQWDTLFDGEVSAGKLYHSFPEPIRLRMQDVLSVEKVLGSYPAMVFLTDVGFFRVTRCDYNKALSLASVSQMGPKYRIKREYVEERLLATKQQAKIAA